MKYRVIVTPDAEDGIRAMYRYIRARAPQAAQSLRDGIRRKIKSLADHAERGRNAPESGLLTEPVREIFYGRGNRGTYRILYVIRERTVWVLLVKQGSQLP